MKFTGFISEEDQNIPGARTFSDMFMSENYPEDYRNKVIHFFENDFPAIAGVTTFLRDRRDNERIGGCSYHTDGTYIWPLYYTFYLKKYSNFYIDSEFYHHIERGGFSTKQLDKKQLSELESLFVNYWSGKISK